MTFEELEIKLGRKLNRDEWEQYKKEGWYQNTIKINGKIELYDNSIAYENCELSGYLNLRNKAQVYGNSKLTKYIFIYDSSKVYDNAKLSNCVYLYSNSKIHGNAELEYDIDLYDNVEIYGNCKIKGPLNIYGNIKIYGDVEINCEILKELDCYINKSNYYFLKGDFEIYDHKSLKAAVAISNIMNGL